MDPAGDSEILRVWSLLCQVSEQLGQNRSSAVNLHALTDGTKAQAIHSQTGFVLRRFNLDKSKEVYDAELERMNAAISSENQTLLNDNRQLSALIREYEQTLENIMATFRTRAHEVQQHELALMRQYESVIIQRETETLDESLTVNNARSESLARIGRMLRIVLRRLGGEDVPIYEAHLAQLAHLHALAQPARTSQSREPSSTSSNGIENGASSVPSEGGHEEHEAENSRKGKERDDEAESPDHSFFDPDNLLEEDEDPEKRLAAAEWALDRECELARLERENEELRALVHGFLKPEGGHAQGQRAAEPPTTSTLTSAPIPIPEHANGNGENEEVDRESDEHASFSTFSRPQRLLGGPPGTVGPFGTYKKSMGMRMDSR